VDRAATPRIHFNLAHSEDCIVYALALEREIGVDVERVRELPHLELIARSAFCWEEFQEIHNIDPARRTEACWTRREAFLKALGCGLSASLDASRVSLIPGQPAALLRFDRESDRLYTGASGT